MKDKFTVSYDKETGRCFNEYLPVSLSYIFICNIMVLSIAFYVQLTSPYLRSQFNFTVKAIRSLPVFCAVIVPLWCSVMAFAIDSPIPKLLLAVRA